MKKTIFILFILFPLLSSAQFNIKGIGLRGGITNGIIVDFNDTGRPIRTILSFRNSGMQVTGLQMLYHPLEWKSKYGDWEWYYGYGIHAGFERFDRIHKRKDGNFVDYSITQAWSPCIGGDGILGISINLNRYPITISADLKPFLNIGGQKLVSVNKTDGAIGIIYHIIK